MISFTDERPEGSGAKLDSVSRSYEEGDFTICLDKYITSINGYINLVFSDDFTLAIPNALDRLVLQFKGIWYYAFNVPNIEPFPWVLNSRLLMSNFKLETQKNNKISLGIFADFDGGTCSQTIYSLL